MKKLLTVIACVLFMAGLHAQFSPFNYTDEEMQIFLGTQTTFVIETKDAAFNELLEQCMHDYWTISKYKLVSAKEAGKYMGQRNYSFIMPIYFTLGTTDNMFLCLVNGGKKIEEPRDMLFYTPLDSKYDYADLSKDLSLDSTLLSERYRLKDIIAGMNRTLELLKKLDKKVNNKASGQRPPEMYCKACEVNMELMLTTFYNKDLTLLKTKTLYIPEGLVEKKTDIAKCYPYKFKVLKRPAFEEAVSKAPKDMLYMVATHNVWGGMIIVDPSSHNIVGGLSMDYLTYVHDGTFKNLLDAMKKAEKDAGK